MTVSLCMVPFLSFHLRLGGPLNLCSDRPWSSCCDLIQILDPPVVELIEPP